MATDSSSSSGSSMELVSNNVGSFFGSVFQNPSLQLLSRSPPPSLNEACAAVQHEELHRKAMLRPVRVENAARSETLPSRRPPRPGRLQCEHCMKLVHTKDRCWELVGRPTAGLSPSRSKGKAKQAPSQALVSSTIGSGGLTEEEIQLSGN
ncbi:hypothetical protein Droror1_Dr00023232 [Drosera rotundifolia]